MKINNRMKINSRIVLCNNRIL